MNTDRRHELWKDKWAHDYRRAQLRQIAVELFGLSMLGIGVVVGYLIWGS